MNKYYVERDVSWMYFNARILDAAQPGPPHRGAGTGANLPWTGEGEATSFRSQEALYHAYSEEIISQSPTESEKI